MVLQVLLLLLDPEDLAVHGYQGFQSVQQVLEDQMVHVVQVVQENLQDL